MIKYIKTFTIITLLTLSFPILQAQEAGLTGLPSFSFNIRPDYWCDSFNNNPAYSTLYKDLMINVFTNVSVDPMFYSNKEKSGSASSDGDRDSLDMELTAALGMIIPIQDFRLGFNLEFDADLSREERKSSYSGSSDSTLKILEDKSGYFLKGEVLLANRFKGKLKDRLSFGYKGGINTLLYQNDTNINHNSSSTDQDESRKDSMFIETDHNPGIIFQTEKCNFSFSLPVYGSYLKREYKKEVEGETVIESEDMIYNGKVLLNWTADIKASEKVSIRLPFSTGFHWIGYNCVYLDVYNDTYDYDFDYDLNGYTLERKPYYTYSVPVNTGMSITHAVTEKVKLTGAFSLSGLGRFTNFEYTIRAVESNDYIRELYGYADLCLAGEFKVSKWLTIRGGVSTSLFQLEVFREYNRTNNKGEIESEPIDNNTSYEVKVPFATTISGCFEIKPVKSVAIELESDFFTTGIEFSRLSGSSSNNNEETTINEQTQRFSCSFKVNVIILLEKKTKNENKNKNEDEDENENEVENEDESKTEQPSS